MPTMLASPEVSKPDAQFFYKPDDLFSQQSQESKRWKLDDQEFSASLYTIICTQYPPLMTWKHSLSIRKAEV